MTNTDDTDRMTDSERLEEVAALLALGLLRLQVRQAGGQKKREFFRDNGLAVPPETSPPVSDL